MNIKNIIFDMGGVLIDFNPREIASRFVNGKEEIETLVQAIFETPEWALLDWGLLTEDEVIKIAEDRLPADLKKFAKLCVKKWDNPIIPIDGMSDILKECKCKGYKLYLLSNAGPRHKEYFKNVPGNEYFDGIVVSAYEKDCKPFFSFYNTLLNRYKLIPEECLFIDDNIINLGVAKKLGINCYHFIGSKYLKDYIKIL